MREMFLTRELLKAISFRNQVKLPLTYWVLVCLRFVFTILPQHGYIHPDEFFQNVEVIAGIYLNMSLHNENKRYITTITLQTCFKTLSTFQVIFSTSMLQEHGSSTRHFPSEIYSYQS